MMVLRVLSAEKSGKQSLDVAGLLKIRGSEIQQRYTELMMLAAGPSAVPLIKEAMEAGWQAEHADAGAFVRRSRDLLQHAQDDDLRRSNEVQRNIVRQTVLGS
jgi:hypothetical protein